MNVPPAKNPKWSAVIAGDIRVDLEFLATKILLGTLSRTWAKDPSPSTLGKCADELREFFVQNADLPSVRKDLKKLFGQEADDEKNHVYP